MSAALSSPLPGGERSRGEAERVRGLCVLPTLLPLTRRRAPTPPPPGAGPGGAPAGRAGTGI